MAISGYAERPAIAGPAWGLLLGSVAFFAVVLYGDFQRVGQALAGFLSPGCSLDNSGFFQLFRKVMKWLSDDTTYFHYSL